MRKIFALLAFASASLLGVAAKAAPVDIYVMWNGSTTFGIYAMPSPDVGNIALHVVGFSGRTLMPLPQISIPDSVFVGGSLGANLLVTSFEGQNLLPQTAGPSDLIHLMNMTVFTWWPVVSSGDDAFSYTVLNQALTEPIPYRLFFETEEHQIVLVDQWLPEPATTVPVGLGLAALMLVRRAA